MDNGIGCIVGGLIVLAVLVALGAFQLLDTFVTNVVIEKAFDVTLPFWKFFWVMLLKNIVWGTIICLIKLPIKILAND